MPSGWYDGGMKSTIEDMCKEAIAEQRYVRSILNGRKPLSWNRCTEGFEETVSTLQTHPLLNDPRAVRELEHSLTMQLRILQLGMCVVALCGVGAVAVAVWKIWHG